jgi:hypothetical protein
MPRRRFPIVDLGFGSQRDANLVTIAVETYHWRVLGRMRLARHETGDDHAK